MSLNAVRIENPRRGYSGYTSPKSALQFVKRGRAKWTTPTSIRFILSSELIELTDTQKENERKRQREYQGERIDGISQVRTYREIKRLPVVNVDDLIGPRGRWRPQPRGMSAATINYVPQGTPGAVGAPIA